MRDWDPGLGEVEVAPSPCRTIPITPELRAADEASRREREAGNSSDWKVKATLSEDNLRRARVQTSPGRHATVMAAEKDTRKDRKPRSLQPLVMSSPSLGRELAAAPPLERKPMPKPTATFTMLKPVAEAEAPKAYTLSGRVSPYLPIYTAVCELAKGAFLPITVELKQHGLAISQALRKMADKDGKAIEQRTAVDGLTVYFRRVDKPEVQK